MANICGSLPAVLGWDIGGIDRAGPGSSASHNLDDVPFAKMRGWIRHANALGVMNTVSMHLDNPLTGNWSAPSHWNGAGSAWDNTPGTVAAMLDTSSAVHAQFLQKLSLVAKFFLQACAPQRTPTHHTRHRLCHLPAPRGLLAGCADPHRLPAVPRV